MRTVRIAVVGASGFLGAELCRDALRRGWDVVATFLRTPGVIDDVQWQRLDLRESSLSLPPVDALVNAAYVQNGPDVDAVTADAPARLATLAPRFVHLSSDLVFAGDRSTPYTERDSPSPVNDYGRAKAVSESKVAEIRPDATIVRTSLLYGFPNPGRIEHDILAAATGKTPMVFFTDEVRCPIHVADLAHAVLDQVASSHPITGPLHLVGARPMSRATFAARIAKSYGHRTDLLRYGSRPVDGPPRPKHVVLKSVHVEGFDDDRLAAHEELSQ